MADEGKPKRELVDQLKSAPWPSFVKDRRPAELTISGLRTKNLIRNFHLKDLIDVLIFRLAGSSGIARCGRGGAQGELCRPTMN